MASGITSSGTALPILSIKRRAIQTCMRRHEANLILKNGKQLMDMKGCTAKWKCVSASPECSAAFCSFLLKDLRRQKLHLCTKQLSVYFSTSTSQLVKPFIVYSTQQRNSMACSMQKKGWTEEFGSDSNSFPALFCSLRKKAHLTAECYVILYQRVTGS